MTFERDPGRPRPDDEDTLPQPYAEITITEPELTPTFDDDEEEKTPGSTIDVRILDFKDGHSSVSVSHGPVDPSRVWIAFQNRNAYLHLSFEEGIVRKLADGLRTVLATFQQVRCAINERDPR